MRVRLGYHLRHVRDWSLGPFVIRLHRWVKAERTAPVLLSDDEVTPALPVERAG
jgi:hypothetical protein